MADVYYYVDAAGQQQGPVASAEVAGLIQRGAVRAETLVWTAGMNDWARADAVAAFAGAFGPAPPPMQARGAPPAPPSAASAAGGPLVGALPAWGLFWRTVVMVLGILFVIPAPWAGLWFYKWFAGKVILPGARPLRLDSGLGEVWWLFVALGLLQWLGPGLDYGLGTNGFGLLASLIEVVLGWALARWFCAHLATDDGATKIAFTGGVLAYVGWSLLIGVSFVTIIGWAWAAKYFLRWMARRIDGAPRFAFVGGGFAILWRTLLLSFGSILIVTIPWLMKWYLNWMISQFVVEPAAAA